MLDVPVSRVGLQRARVVTLIGQRVAAGVPKHMRVRLEPKLGVAPSSLDHAGEAGGAKGRSPLRSEHEGRLGLLLTLEAPP